MLSTPRLLAWSTLTLTSSIALGSCSRECPELQDRPTPTTYEIVGSDDPSLIGARVTVTEETLTIEYDSNGVPVTVVYDVGEHL